MVSVSNELCRVFNSSRGIVIGFFAGFQPAFSDRFCRKCPKEDNIPTVKTFILVKLKIPSRHRSNPQASKTMRKQRFTGLFV